MLERSINVSFPGYPDPPRIWVENGTVWEVHVTTMDAPNGTPWLTVEGADAGPICALVTGMDYPELLDLAAHHSGSHHVLHIEVVAVHEATPAQMDRLRAGMTEQMLPLPVDNSLENCYDGAHIAFRTWPDGALSPREARCAGTEAFEDWRAWFNDWLQGVVA